MPELTIEQPVLKQFADIVYENSGIVFRESNISVLISRISSKIKEKKTDVKSYLNLLKTQKNELMSFIDFVTTNFTSFFRNKRHFEILQDHVLPELIKTKVTKKLKIWSAGCSTGEEVYSIAIVLREFFTQHRINIEEWDIQILGSDISLESLFIAKEAKYPAQSLRNIEKPIIEKYFIPHEDNKFYTLKNEIRNMVKFDFHNLIYTSNFNQVDITFCRNVLIYFDLDIQRKVLDQIYKSMNPSGFLFIGHSESLIGLYDQFKPKSYERGIIYVKQ